MSRLFSYAAIAGTFALFGLATPSIAAAAEVELEVLVIQAEKGTGTLEEALKPHAERIAKTGFGAAKLVDRVSRKVEQGSSVSLQILEKFSTVKLLDVTKDGTVKLAIEIKDFNFKAKTSHIKGGTIIVVKKTGKDSALLLAVTPKVRE